MIRLIVPLTAALVIVHGAQVFAQSAFPAPLPNQSAAPANASPFPPVNGAARSALRRRSRPRVRRRFPGLRSAVHRSRLRRAVGRTPA